MSFSDSYYKLENKLNSEPTNDDGRVQRVFANITQTTSDLWTNTGNYTVNWSGLTGVWSSDQILYNNTTQFIIQNAADFAAFIRILNANSNYTFLGKVVMLIADIDLSGHYWDMAGGSKTGPTNSFSGTFEGGGFTVSNMNINYYAYDINYIGEGSNFGSFGLFPDLYKATIKDLNINDTVIVIGNYAPSYPLGVGILTGMTSGALIENVAINNASIGQIVNNGQGISGGFYFGGIAGASYNPYTRNNPQNLPNSYLNCSVDGLSIDYTQPIDQGWKYILAFGGLFGGDFAFGAVKTQLFQSRVIDCVINNFTVTRGNLNTAFMYECYGGLIGFNVFPTYISDVHVTNLDINLNNAATVNGTTFGEYGPASALVGGIIGYGGIDTEFNQGEYMLEKSSAQGVISAMANPNLLPVFIGGLFGMNDSPAISCIYNYTKFDFSELYKNKNDKLIYANLFGKLDQPNLISQNIFNNWDYIAKEPEEDGYAGRKLSTFTIAGDLKNTNKIDLSKNWGITKNIMIVNIEGYPLNYIQCDESSYEEDFYDYWKVISYSNDYLTQGNDKAKVTFIQDSSDSYWIMKATISSVIENKTWMFAKNIRVIKTGYIIISSAGIGGDISPLGNVAVENGGDKHFTIMVEEGYRILDVLVDGRSIGAVSSYTFINVIDNHTIHVDFIAINPNSSTQVRGYNIFGLK